MEDWKTFVTTTSFFALHNADVDERILDMFAPLRAGIIHILCYIEGQHRTPYINRCQDNMCTFAFLAEDLFGQFELMTNVLHQAVSHISGQLRICGPGREDTENFVERAACGLKTITKHRATRYPELTAVHHMLEGQALDQRQVADPSVAAAFHAAAERRQSTSARAIRQRRAREALKDDHDARHFLLDLSDVSSEIGEVSFVHLHLAQPVWQCHSTELARCDSDMCRFCLQIAELERVFKSVSKYDQSELSVSAQIPLSKVYDVDIADKPKIFRAKRASMNAGKFTIGTDQRVVNTVDYFVYVPFLEGDDDGISEDIACTHCIIRVTGLYKVVCDGTARRFVTGQLTEVQPVRDKGCDVVYCDVTAQRKKTLPSMLSSRGARASQCYPYAVWLHQVEAVCASGADHTLFVPVVKSTFRG